MTGYDVIECMEASFSRGEFKPVDWFLEGLDPGDMTPNQIISVLTMGLHARDQLSELVPFSARAEKELVECLGAQRTFNLLRMRDPR